MDHAKTYSMKNKTLSSLHLLYKAGHRKPLRAGISGTFALRHWGFFHLLYGLFSISASEIKIKSFTQRLAHEEWISFIYHALAFVLTILNNNLLSWFVFLTLMYAITWRSKQHVLRWRIVCLVSEFVRSFLCPSVGASLSYEFYPSPILARLFVESCMWDLRVGTVKIKRGW